MKPWSQYWLIAAGAYPGFCSMKRLGIFLLSLDGMLINRRSLPRNLLGFLINSPVPIHTPGWREALWEVSCLRTRAVFCALVSVTTSWSVRSSSERSVRARALAGDTVLCSWARHLTLTVPLSTQVNNWVPANLVLGATLRWTSIPSRGDGQVINCKKESTNTPSRFMLRNSR